MGMRTFVFATTSGVGSVGKGLSADALTRAYREVGFSVALIDGSPFNADSKQRQESYRVSVPVSAPGLSDRPRPSALWTNPATGVKICGPATLQDRLNPAKHAALIREAVGKMRGVVDIVGIDSQLLPGNEAMFAAFDESDLIIYVMDNTSKSQELQFLPMMLSPGDEREMPYVPASRFGFLYNQHTEDDPGWQTRAKEVVARLQRDLFERFPATPKDELTFRWVGELPYSRPLFMAANRYQTGDLLPPEVSNAALKIVGELSGRSAPLRPTVKAPRRMPWQRRRQPDAPAPIERAFRDWERAELVVNSDGYVPVERPDRFVRVFAASDEAMFSDSSLSDEHRRMSLAAIVSRHRRTMGELGFVLGKTRNVRPDVRQLVADGWLSPSSDPGVFLPPARLWVDVFELRALIDGSRSTVDESEQLHLVQRMVGMLRSFEGPAFGSRAGWLAGFDGRARVFEDGWPPAGHPVKQAEDALYEALFVVYSWVMAARPGVSAEVVLNTIELILDRCELDDPAQAREWAMDLATELDRREASAGATPAGLPAEAAVADVAQIAAATFPPPVIDAPVLPAVPSVAPALLVPAMAEPVGSSAGPRVMLRVFGVPEIVAADGRKVEQTRCPSVLFLLGVLGVATSNARLAEITGYSESAIGFEYDGKHPLVLRAEGLVGLADGVWPQHRWMEELVQRALQVLKTGQVSHAADLVRTAWLFAGTVTGDPAVDHSPFAVVKPGKSLGAGRKRGAAVSPWDWLTSEPLPGGLTARDLVGRSFARAVIGLTQLWEALPAPDALYPAGDVCARLCAAAWMVPSSGVGDAAVEGFYGSGEALLLTAYRAAAGQGDLKETVRGTATSMIDAGRIEHSAKLAELLEFPDTLR